MDSYQQEHMIKKAYRLSDRMAHRLIFTEPGDLMMPGPTRAALMRRGLVHNMESKDAMKLTGRGVGIRRQLRAVRGYGQ